MNTNFEKDDPLFYRVGPKKTKEASVPHDAHVEKHILKISVYCALFYAVLGLVWGVLIRSQMLIFDGIYSFVSVFMASFSVYVAETMKTRDDAKFPFGRSQMEPLVIIFKALVILVVCIGALSMSMKSLFSGGNQVNALSAMAYCFIGIIGCLGCWIYIVWKRKKAKLSGLVKAESRQWFMDTLLSVTIFLGFLAAYIIQHTEHALFARYMDPLMVVVSALFFSVTPILSVIGGIKDILRVAPEGNVYRVSRHIIEEIAKGRGFAGFVLRIVKSGRELVYEIGFVSDNPEDARTMGELDDIRQEVENKLKALYDNPIWLDISFMYNKKWG